MTRSKRILKILYNTQEPGLTCSDLTKMVIRAEKAKGNIAKYMSGSVSAKLNALVKADKVIILEHLKGPKGGKTYSYKYF